MDTSNPLDTMGRRAMHAMRRTETALSPWVRRALQHQHDDAGHMGHTGIGRGMGLNELPLRRLRRRIARHMNEDASLAGDIGSLSPELVQHFTDRVVNRLPMRKLASKYEAAAPETTEQAGDEAAAAMPLANANMGEAPANAAQKSDGGEGGAPMMTAADVINRLQTQMPNLNATVGPRQAEPPGGRDAGAPAAEAKPSLVNRIQAARDTAGQPKASPAPAAGNIAKPDANPNPATRPTASAVRRFSRVEEVSHAAPETPSLPAQPRNRASSSKASNPSGADAGMDDDTGPATVRPSVASPANMARRASSAGAPSAAPLLTAADVQRAEEQDAGDAGFDIHRLAEQHMASPRSSTAARRAAPRLLQLKRNPERAAGDADGAVDLDLDGAPEAASNFESDNSAPAARASKPASTTIQRSPARPSGADTAADATNRSARASASKPSSAGPSSTQASRSGGSPAAVTASDPDRAAVQLARRETQPGAPAQAAEIPAARPAAIETHAATVSAPTAPAHDAQEQIARKQEVDAAAIAQETAAPDIAAPASPAMRIARRESIPEGAAPAPIVDGAASTPALPSPAAGELQRMGKPAIGGDTAFDAAAGEAAGDARLDLDMPLARKTQARRTGLPGVDSDAGDEADQDAQSSDGPSSRTSASSTSRVETGDQKPAAPVMPPAPSQASAAGSPALSRMAATEPGAPAQAAAGAGSGSIPPNSPATSAARLMDVGSPLPDAPVRAVVQGKPVQRKAAPSVSGETDSTARPAAEAGPAAVQRAPAAKSAQIDAAGDGARPNTGALAVSDADATAVSPDSVTPRIARAAAVDAYDDAEPNSGLGLNGQPAAISDASHAPVDMPLAHVRRMAAPASPAAGADGDVALNDEVAGSTAQPHTSAPATEGGAAIQRQAAAPASANPAAQAQVGSAAVASQSSAAATEGGAAIQRQPAAPASANPAAQAPVESEAVASQPSAAATEGGAAIQRQPAAPASANPAAPVQAISAALEGSHAEARPTLPAQPGASLPHVPELQASAALPPVVPAQLETLPAMDTGEPSVRAGAAAEMPLVRRSAVRDAVDAGDDNPPAANDSFNSDAGRQSSGAQATPTAAPAAMNAGSSADSRTASNTASSTASNTASNTASVTSAATAPRGPAATSGPGITGAGPQGAAPMQRKASAAQPAVQSEATVDVRAMARMAQSVQRLPLSTNTRRLARLMRAEFESSAESPAIDDGPSGEAARAATSRPSVRRLQRKPGSLPVTSRARLSSAQAIQRMTQLASQAFPAEPGPGSAAVPSAVTPGVRSLADASPSQASVPTPTTDLADAPALTLFSRLQPRRMTRPEVMVGDVDDDGVDLDAGTMAAIGDTPSGSRAPAAPASAAARIARKVQSGSPVTSGASPATPRAESVKRTLRRNPAEVAGTSAAEAFNPLAPEGGAGLDLPVRLQRKTALSASSSAEWGNITEDEADDAAAADARRVDPLNMAWPNQPAQIGAMAATAADLPLVSRKARVAPVSTEGAGLANGDGAGMLNAETLMRASMAESPSSSPASTSSSSSSTTGNSAQKMPLNVGPKPSAAGVVQRLVTESTAEQSDSADTGEAPVIAPRLPELADLARQVYPLIKRLIALERERMRSF